MRNWTHGRWILDTHPHADHFSAASYLKEKTGAPTAIGDRIIEVQALWQQLYNWPEFATDGSQWDRLFSAGDSLQHRRPSTSGDVFARPYACLGHLCRRRRRLHPRHAVHARQRHCAGGFPGRQRSTRLWRSIQAILSLPDDDTAVHRPRLPARRSTSPNGKARSPSRSAATSISRNATTEAEFVTPARQRATRHCRCRRLILHALQININGGRLPEPEANGQPLPEAAAQRSRRRSLGLVRRIAGLVHRP